MSYAFAAGGSSTMYCDVFGTPTTPNNGDQLNVCKLATGAAGALTLVATANPLPVQHGNGAQTMPSGDAAARPIYTTPTAVTTGGATPFKRVSTADTNAAVVKASAGTVYGIQVSNVNAAVRYLKLYDKATTPTVGTDVPVKTLALPGTAAGSLIQIPLPPMGVAFANGISIALTTEATDAGSTGVAANELVVNIDYK